MKLRTRGNSIRLRLTRSEVLALSEGMTVRDETRITPLDSFVVTLEGWNLDVFQVTSNKEGLRICAPASRILQWSKNDDEGIYGYQENGSSEPLKISIEKDFACLEERPGEDSHDQFPHPDSSGKKC